MGDIKLSLVPVSIIAKTPEELTLACFENNLKYKKMFQYFDIQKSGKGWIAWFMQDITEVIDGEIK